MTNLKQRMWTTINQAMMAFGVVIILSPYVVIAQSSVRDEIAGTRIDNLDRRMEKLEAIEIRSEFAVINQRLSQIDKNFADMALVQKVNAGGIGSLLLGGGLVVRMLLSQHKSLQIRISESQSEKEEG